VYLVVELCHNGEVNRFMKKTGKPFSESQGDDIWQYFEKLSSFETTFIVTKYTTWSVSKYHLYQIIQNFIQASH
jgi:predicted glutamine amidotransferase